MFRIIALTLSSLLCILIIPTHAQNWKGKFEQLGSDEIPTPNNYRTGSGSPGPDYWQQRADYVIEAEVNDEKQELTGKEVITYYNNSPEPLNYLWMQLEQNIFSKDAWL